MSEKRYYKREYGEEYYIFDSLIISEDILEKRIEYEGYTAFEDSMTGDEIVNLLNEQQNTINELEDDYDEEEIIGYLRAYHSGDVNEIKM